MQLSIITINKDNATGLQKTIDSVLCQTFTDYEWIVIDGGSTDGSRDIILSQEAHFTYWVSEPDRGIYHAMNKGIAVAKGQWLLFLNSGDFLPQPGTLNIIFDNPILKQADILYGNYQKVQHDTTSGTLCTPPKELSFLHVLFNGLCHQATFIRRELFDTYRYDESYAVLGDMAGYLHFMLQGYRFLHLDEVVVCFDMDGISSTNRNAIEKDRERLLQQAIPYHLQQDLQPLIEQHYMCRHRLLRTLLRLQHRTNITLYHILTHIEHVRTHKK